MTAGVAIRARPEPLGAQPIHAWAGAEPEPVHSPAGLPGPGSVGQSALTSSLAVCLARRALKRRTDRREHFGPVLGQDGVWNMLLELFAAKEEGRLLSKKCLWLASGLAQSTCVRWVNYLASRGVVTERDDPADGRRQFIELNELFARRIAVFIEGSEI